LDEHITPCASGATTSITINTAEVFLGRPLRRTERELVELAVVLAERRLELTIADLDDMEAEADVLGGGDLDESR
jgi:hypothetical protein